MERDLIERLRGGYTNGSHLRWTVTDGHREAADRIEALERENATLRAERDEARRKTIEEAAQIADECDIAMGLIVGGPDGASIARRTIAAAIRNMGGEG